MKAAASNNVATALTLSGILQTALGYVQQGRRLELAIFGASLISLAIGAAFFAAARPLTASLED